MNAKRGGKLWHYSPESGAPDDPWRHPTSCSMVLAKSGERCVRGYQHRGQHGTWKAIDDGRRER